MTLWKYELHAHTSPASRCSRLSPKNMIDKLAGEGYNAVVITDHYDPERFFGVTKGRRFRVQLHDLFDGWRAAVEAGKQAGIAVFPGIELRIESGIEDYLLFGINEEIALDVGYLGHKSLEEVREVLNPLGVLIVQAHPFRVNMRRALPELLDGIEVYNANIRHKPNNSLSFEFAREHSLLMTVGSDVHQNVDVGRAWMMLPPVKDERELAAMLRVNTLEPPDINVFPKPHDW